MPMVPGLGLNLRQPAPEMEPLDGQDVTVEIIEGNDNTKIDERGNILEIEHSDGSITISLDGKPIEDSAKERDEDNWFRNLVDSIDQGELTRIANDLVTGFGETREDHRVVGRCERRGAEVAFGIVVDVQKAGRCLDRRRHGLATGPRGLL